MKKDASMCFMPSNLWIMLNIYSETITCGNEYLDYQFSHLGIKRDAINFKKVSLFYRELIAHG